jgi:hypothetical protein
LNIKLFLQKYTGFLKDFKGAYMLNNLLNLDRLSHNKALYQKYGLRKSIVGALGHVDFEAIGHHQDTPWLDREDAEARLDQNIDFQSFTPNLQDKIRQFVREGYLILEGFYSKEDTDQLNTEVDQLLEQGKAGYNFTGRKIFNLWEISNHAEQRFFRHPEILKLLQFLFGKPVIPFQSLNFTLGSEQRPHSDLIHMTTEPEGYLLATWTALEDVEEGCGPLVYYPKSHRLPFISTEDYDSGNTRFSIGKHSNKHYEDKIEEIIQTHGLEKKTFLPRRGDVLIWHANLLHGGSPITRPNATRKSMVCHYYAEGVICYHEMSQRPALMPKVK